MGGDRAGATESLGALMEAERRRLLRGASSERREQLAAAERRRAVLSAWNTVCSGTVEGGHVTGLHYVDSSNELVVYADSAAWTQELSMMREIIRARMAIAGAEVSALVFRTSREGYRSRAMEEAGGRSGAAGVASGSEPPAPRAELSDEELGRVARAVEPIEDPQLKKAVERAMIASLELQSPEKS